MVTENKINLLEELNQRFEDLDAQFKVMINTLILKGYIEELIYAFLLNKVSKKLHKIYGEPK